MLTLPDASRVMRLGETVLGVTAADEDEMGDCEVRVVLGG